MMKLKRLIQFEPGYDCIRFECCQESNSCVPGTGGSHGRHGLQIRWVVIGDKGAIQFLLFTSSWFPEPERLASNMVLSPIPADIGYHAREPQYEGQAIQEENCEFIGVPCYYDGSGLNAEKPFRVLCNDGGDALWEYLEAIYHARFDGAEHPTSKPYKFATRAY